MSFKTFRSLAISLLVLFSASKVAAQSSSSTPPYLDPSLPIDQRVNDLVSRMTLEEKASQMQDIALAIPRLNIPAYNWWNEALHGRSEEHTSELQSLTNLVCRLLLAKT